MDMIAIGTVLRGLLPGVRPASAQSRQATKKQAQGDTFPIYAEITRLAANGYHLSIEQLELPVGVLNFIYNAAYDATPALGAEILSVTLSIIAPQAAQLEPDKAAAQPQGTGVQKALLADLSDEVKNRGNDKAPTEVKAKSKSEGQASARSEDADAAKASAGEVDPYQALYERLDSGLARSGEDRLELAFEILDRAEGAGLDLDDVDAVWTWWLEGLAPVYVRLIATSHNPRNIVDALDLSEQILAAARKRGKTKPAEAWEHFTVHCKLVYTVVDGVRRPTVVEESAPPVSGGGKRGKRKKRR
jgi:hypothetical protein